MNNRINYYTISKDGMNNMLLMESYLSSSTTLEPKLMELVKVRVSQINKCAYCIDTHYQTALELGETQQRLVLLSAWKEANIYSDRETMALKLAELVTHISNQGISETIYKQSLQYFDEKEYVDLILLINQINSWNRLSISMGNQVTLR